MLGKLLVAIPTPFDDNDEVDYDAFEDLILDLKEQKVDGIVVGREKDTYYNLVNY